MNFFFCNIFPCITLADNLYEKTSANGTNERQFKKKVSRFKIEATENDISNNESMDSISIKWLHTSTYFSLEKEKKIKNEPRSLLVT